MSARVDAIDAAEQAYEALLHLPADSEARLSLRTQRALDMLRDFIAEARGADPAAIQADFELLVALQKGDA